jgi:hypothetical protein
MQSIQEILEDSPTPYTGSSKTFEMVAEQIEARWGKKEVKNFDPETNTRTFASWLKLGYRVKKGEKALKSVTYIEKKDAEGKVVQKYPRTVNLFYFRSVEPIKEK